jgi:hypothetical protein
VQEARDEMQWGEEGPPPLLVKIAPDLTKEDLDDVAAVMFSFFFFFTENDFGVFDVPIHLITCFFNKIKLHVLIFYFIHSGAFVGSS